MPKKKGSHSGGLLLLGILLFLSFTSQSSSATTQPPPSTGLPPPTSGGGSGTNPPPTGGGGGNSGGTGSPPTNTTTTTSRVTVYSTDMSGDALNGMWVTIESGGATVSSGYTPLTYSGATGEQDLITVSNYAQYAFDHWATGGMNASIQVTLSGSMAASAYYRVTSAAAGLLVPLFMYPGSAWQALCQEKLAYPQVPVAAIVNPSSGPGSYQDPNFVTGIQQLQAAGIVVYGYVYTSYASRSASSVEADIDAYRSFYGVTNIMLDEMSDQVTAVGYYAALGQYVHSFGGKATGNPGTTLPASFVGTLDNFVIYEATGSPTVGQLSSLGATKATWSYVAYGVPSLSPTLEKATAAYVGYVYITDDALPNPYDVLPSYLGAEMAALAGP